MNAFPSPHGPLGGQGQGPCCLHGDDSSEWLPTETFSIQKPRQKQRKKDHDIETSDKLHSSNILNNDHI